jgi:hypothetical protein
MPTPPSPPPPPPPPTHTHPHTPTNTQGDEDEIVPPEQSELMWQALKDKGLPTTLMMYKVGCCTTQTGKLGILLLLL